MKKFAVLFTLAFLLAGPASGQIKLTWQLLSDVEFEPTWMEEYQASFLMPDFGDGPRAYDGKEVLITGYFIPINMDEPFLILSANPYTSCYFCGAAGPESIVEIWFKPGKKRRYKMDELLTLKGILRLNASDVQHCNYILEDAEIY